MNHFSDLPRLPSSYVEALDLDLVKISTYSIAEDQGSDEPSCSLADVLAALGAPDQLVEFSEIARHLRLGSQFKVLRVAAWGEECGFAYIPGVNSRLEDTYVVALDERKIPSGLSLQELFLHELAHGQTASGEQHDWQFVVALNLLRARCGYGPTKDSYDCRDVVREFQDVGVEEILSRATSQAALLERVLGDAALDVVRQLGEEPLIAHFGECDR